MSPASIKRILETAILCKHGPLPLIYMEKMLAGLCKSDAIEPLLNEIQSDWSSSNIHLFNTKDGWEFKSVVHR